MPVSTIAPPRKGLSDADLAVAWGEGTEAGSVTSSPVRDRPSRPQPSIRVKGESPAWLSPTIDRLNRLLRLPENWDRDGAPPVDARAAVAALKLLGSVARPDTPAPSIVPADEGGVQLEWHMGEIDLEVEVTPLGRVHGFFADNADDDEWEADLTCDVTPLVMALSLLWCRR